MERARVTLRVYSDHLTADEISACLDRKPEHGHSKGDVNPRTGKAFQESLWWIKSVSTSDDLEDHIEEMVEYLEANRAQFDKTRDRCSADLFCFFVTRGGQAGLVLQSDMMLRMANLGLRLVLDIYGDE